MPSSGRGLTKSARKSVFSNKSGVTDIRFGRSLAFWKAKSKGYNLIKGSELKEVVLDLDSGFESGRGLTKSARKSVFSNKSGVTDLRFGRSLAFWKPKSKGYNLIKGSELKEVVLDLESGFEVGTKILSAFWNQFWFLGSLRTFWKAKSKGYNIIKGSELKEVVLDLESGFEKSKNCNTRCVGNLKHSPKTLLKTLSSYQVVLRFKYRLTKSARKSVFSNKSGVTDLRFGRSLAFWKAKSKGYNLIKGSELKEVVLDLESGFEV
ncbi:hypothetical protein NE237_003855 [Protea cynaroides]|uniref:Uncharacterized protein n=1 Tax=Protea cynaroides TaxID=273540 RepID=A0A9Q0KI74_9MAGN|nr:hypothetical protein NE237_003855 [Protea cynaroides]